MKLLIICVSMIALTLTGCSAFHPKPSTGEVEQVLNSKGCSLGSIVKILDVKSKRDGYTTGRGIVYVPYQISFETSTGAQYKMNMYYEPEKKRWLRIDDSKGNPKPIVKVNVKNNKKNDGK